MNFINFVRSACNEYKTMECNFFFFFFYQTPPLPQTVKGHAHEATIGANLIIIGTIVDHTHFVATAPTFILCLI